tara:strand:- start:532 stop:795 length:264 start_codon:yes stop_codon:yes gene_type:complete
MGLNLNQNHWAALVFTIMAWVTGWYALVLITATNRSTDTRGNPIDETKFPLNPTINQYYGLGFSVGIAVLVWLKNVYAIQGDEEQQD